VRVKLGEMDLITLDVSGTVVERFDTPATDAALADGPSQRRRGRRRRGVWPHRHCGRCHREAKLPPIILPRELADLQPLQIALGISIAAHALLLTVRFVDPEAFNRVFQDTPLEVILVNARTTEQPDKATAIAQASMAGGGDADSGRATSPLPPALISESGEVTEDQQEQRKLQNLQELQNLMLAQVKSQLAGLPPPDPTQPELSPDRIEREAKRRQLIKLLAEIERRINQENTPAEEALRQPFHTRGSLCRCMYDHMRRAIEDKGTENFPEFGGKKLYGELTMIVSVNFDGQLIETEIVKSSGNRMHWTASAEVIARSAGPFGPFTVAMRRQADQIAYPVSRFKFTRDETLEAAVSAHP
jgi:protein TonB